MVGELENLCEITLFVVDWLSLFRKNLSMQINIIFM